MSNQKSLINIKLQKNLRQNILEKFMFKKETMVTMMTIYNGYFQLMTNIF